MTRVNTDLDPKLLKRLHLVAELREITMVPAALRRSLRTKSQEEVLKSIPPTFRLNAGHVKFFYDKLEFLRKRFNKLADEMERRGYKPDRSRIVAFDGFDEVWYNDWTPSKADDAIILTRLQEKIDMKPHLYKD